MKLFEVSSDSTCDLYREEQEKRGIWFAPLTFSMEKDGKQEEYLDNFSSYEEYVDFYKKVRGGAIPRTAMLNYEAHYEHFMKLAKSGAKDVVHFSISSGLARTVTVAKEAAEAVKKEYPAFNVYAVDPLTATVGQGMLVKMAAECRDRGMTAQEAYDLVGEAKHRMQHCVIPDDLYYLQRGGRVSKMSAVFGTALKIKPIIVFDSEGKLKVIDKQRGMKKAFFYGLDMLDRAPLDEEWKQITVVHTDNESEANELARLIEERIGVKPCVQAMGPTIGTHVGPGSVSFSWLSTKTRAEILG